ncbi:MAG TPA: transglutaminase-like domain-containing protein [Gemmataceae bacterium]|nr:transglutaminase-like domain-containing protein [Gemmataceae bacterium]
MDLDTALPLLAREPAAPLDLAELALCLARDEYPALDVEAYLGELAGMAHEARRYLRGRLEDRARGLCRYLFHDLGFRGNTRDYYDARNSYLNDVLDRRTGIPLTLSVVAMVVGGRAGLEVAGVGLPGHFVAKAVGEGREVLFDPFHGGRLLAPEQCEALVEQVTGQPYRATAATFAALPLGPLTLRMLNNLKGAYLRAGDFGRAVRVMERLRQLSPDDPLQRRDLGAALLHAGRPGRAIDHLEAYLAARPDAGDATAVRRLLLQARGEVARWN